MEPGFSGQQAYFGACAAEFTRTRLPDRLTRALARNDDRHPLIRALVSERTLSMPAVSRSIGRWLLLEGDRQVIATVLLLAVWLTLVTLGRLGVITVAEPGAVRGVAGGLIPGLFTFLSIVLAINQLVLSQEFGSAAEVRSRIQEVRAFRHDVEHVAHEHPSPVVPTGFLTLVVRTLEVKATTLQESLTGDVDEEAREAVTRYAETVASEAHAADEILTRRNPGRINALLPVLEYQDAWQLYEARRIRDRYGGTLSPKSRQAVEDVIEVLELFSVARTHFRTTYTQRVLARLSRFLLYVGVPALVVTFVLLLLPGATDPVIPERLRLVMVSALLAATLAPLALLFSYILRIATISERTIAIGPFVSRPNAQGHGPGQGGEQSSLEFDGIGDDEHDTHDRS